MTAAQERFWSKVRKTPGYWEWTAARMGGRYGSFYLDGRVQGAHRVAYTLAVGVIPDGMLIDHVCHNKGCVNPAHLRLASKKQNAENLINLVANNTSGFRGVTWDKRTGRWRARVFHHGKPVCGGRHDSAEDAARAASEIRRALFTHNDSDRALKAIGRATVKRWAS